MYVLATHYGGIAGYPQRNKSVQTANQMTLIRIGPLGVDRNPLI